MVAQHSVVGSSSGIVSLLVLRLACGLFEAGAYPVCSGIVRTWVPPSRRGFASGVVAVGGRLGGALAPVLTIQLMLWWSYGGDYWTAVNSEPAITSWRPVMMIYGVVGIVIALIFVWLYRDRPARHPLVSPEELKIIYGDEPSIKRRLLNPVTNHHPLCRWWACWAAQVCG